MTRVSLPFAEISVPITVLISGHLHRPFVSASNGTFALILSLCPSASGMSAFHVDIAALAVSLALHNERISDSLSINFQLLVIRYSVLHTTSMYRSRHPSGLTLANEHFAKCYRKAEIKSGHLKTDVNLQKPFLPSQPMRNAVNLITSLEVNRRRFI